MYAILENFPSFLSGVLLTVFGIRHGPFVSIALILNYKKIMCVFENFHFYKTNNRYWDHIFKEKVEQIVFP